MLVALRMIALVLLRVMDVTGWNNVLSTVMLQETLSPLCVSATIPALPAFTPVTSPWLSTVATDGSVLIHFIVLSVVFPGATVAVS